MRRTRSTELEKTAYHEAGHAVLAVLLGVGLKAAGVSIVPHEPDREGMNKVPSLGHCAVDMNDSVKMFQFVSICLAGHVAQNLFRPRSSHWLELGGRGSDFYRAVTVLEASRKSKSIEDGRWTDSYIRIVQKETKKLLRKQWHAVQTLASALLERKTLTGQEAEAIVKEKMW
jgi:ATP-dependent Zn protease